MASYDYNFYLEYDAITGNATLVDFLTTTGTITDGTAGVGDFTSGEAISGPFSGTYAGTVQIDGQPYPAIYSGGFTIILGSAPDPTAVVNFAIANHATLDVTQGADITDQTFTTCFAAGTLIETPRGERLVETLAVGDLVLTDTGDVVPVSWIGRQTLHTRFAGERARPVRIRAGALGGGLPYDDLVLTPDHALILDDLAITAGALVNGTTITLDPRETLPERVTYFHVETDRHQAILANGIPAETFVDAGTRRAFDNFAEYLDLYGEDRTIPEMQLPRITSARLVPMSIRNRLGLTDAA